MSNTAIVERIAVILEGQASNYYAMMDKVESRITGLKNSAASLGAKLSLGITAPVSALSGLAVKAFADFDDAMTKSTAIMTGVTDETKALMEATATALSEKTSTSADKLAEGYYFLASAGLDAKQSTEALAIANSFAIAGVMDMAQATDELTSSQAALGLKVDDSTQNAINMKRVSDVLVQAGNDSTASVAQFSQALATKSAVAMAEWGISVEEGVSVLEVYASKNIKAANAGEYYSRVLTVLGKEGLKSKEAWAKFGGVFDDTTGKMRPLKDIIASLTEGMEGMTDQQKIAQFEMLGFKAESKAAIAPLLGTADAIETFKGKLEAAGGITDQVTNKQMQSFVKQMAIMKNTTTNVLREIGMGLAPKLQLMNSIMMKGIEVWRGLDDKLKSTIITIVSVAAAVGPLLITFSGILAVLPHLVAGIGTVSKAMRLAAVGARLMWLAFTGPVGLTIAALTAVGAAIYYIISKIVGPEGMTKAWETAKSYVMSFVNNAIGFMQNFGTNMKILWDWLKDNWLTLLIDMGRAYITMVQNNIYNMGVMIQMFVKLLSAFVGWLTIAIPAAFNKIFSYEMLDIILSALIKVGEYVQKMGQGLLNIFKAAFKGVYDIAKQAFSSIITLSSEFARIVGRTIKAVLNGEIPNPLKMMKEFANVALKETTKLAGKVGEEVQQAAKVVTDALASEAKVIGDAFNKGASNINFGETATDIIKEDLKKLKNPLDGFKSELTSLPEFVLSKEQKALDSVTDSVGEGQDKLDEGLDQLKNKGKAVNDLLNDTAAKAEAAASGIEGTLRGSIGAALKIDDFLAKIGTGATAAVGAEVKAASKEAAKGGTTPAATPHENTVEKLLQTIANNTKQQFTPANLAG